MRLLFIPMLIALFATRCFAGLVFEIETRDHGYSPPRTEQTTVHAEGLLLKMANREGQQPLADEMIYRGDRREMVIVDHAQQSFMVIDQQFVTNMMGQLSQVAGQMQGVLDGVPPGQRAAIRQMMKQRGPQAQLPARPKPQVINTGQRATVYGYSCTLFQVTVDGRKTRDVWVTGWGNIVGGRELATTFDSMSGFFQELTSALPMQAEAPIEDSVFATMKQLGGFPVATREYRSDGTVESESALRSAKQLRISLDAFEAPQNYRSQSMFGDAAAFGRSNAAAGQYGQGRR